MCLFAKEKLMLTKKKYGVIPVALFVELLFECYGTGFGVNAAINNNEGGKINNPRSPVGGKYHHHPSHSDFVVKYSGGTPFSAELEYQYLLPEQTIFDSPDELVASKVLLTSPPRLTIQPSHVDHNYQENSFINKEYGQHGAAISISHSLQPEACISEAPTFPFVASSFSTELRTGAQYTITAGRIETASSTDSVNDMPMHIMNKMSQPSTVLLQGTSVSTRSFSEIPKR